MSVNIKVKAKDQRLIGCDSSNVYFLHYICPCKLNVCILHRLQKQMNADFNLTICKPDFATHMHIKDYIKSKLVRVQLGAVGT